MQKLFNESYFPFLQILEDLKPRKLRVICNAGLYLISVSGTKACAIYSSFSLSNLNYTIKPYDKSLSYLKFFKK